MISKKFLENQLTEFMSDKSTESALLIEYSIPTHSV